MAFVYSNSHHADGPPPSDTTFNAEHVEPEAPTFVDHDAPREVQHLRSAPERAMFGDRMVEQRAQKLLDKLPPRGADGNPLDADAARAYAATLASISLDIDLGDADFDELVTLPPPQSIAEVHAWEAETLTELKRRYGDKGMKERVDLAQQLVRRDPRFAQWLTQTGLGSHPRVVEKLIDRAWSQRAAGLL